MTIQAVLFDLDGTLLDRDTSLLRFVHDQYERIGALQLVQKDVFCERFIELDQHGYVWKDKVYEQLVAEFAIPDLDALFLLQDYISQFPQHCIAFPHLHETLGQLQQQGIKLGLISNGFGQFQYANLQALGIAHFFEAVLISEWEGLRKPDPAIFQRALSKLRVPPEQAIYVGDHPENDVRASRAVGMKAVWKRSDQFAAAAEADAVIADLAEVIGIALPAVQLRRQASRDLDFI